MASEARAEVDQLRAELDAERLLGGGPLYSTRQAIARAGLPEGTGSAEAVNTLARERDQARAEVERLTAERDEARKWAISMLLVVACNVGRDWFEGEPEWLETELSDWLDEAEPSERGGQ